MSKDWIHPEGLEQALATANPRPAERMTLSELYEFERFDRAKATRVVTLRIGRKITPSALAKMAWRREGPPFEIVAGAASYDAKALHRWIDDLLARASAAKAEHDKSRDRRIAQ